METVPQILSELEKLATAQTRKTFGRHGVPDNFFGVKVADLKVIAKKIKGNQQLACDLYDSGNADAMYLAGIVANGQQMTSKQLDSWAKKANWHMISEYSVPGVANENKLARKLALKWIDSKKESVASTGWNTYSGIVATHPDEKLDLDEIAALLRRIVDEINNVPDRVKYTMNGFVISVACYVKPLLNQAKETAKELGKVQVNMGDTACKVPFATNYILKVEKLGRIGKKRKTMKC